MLPPFWPMIRAATPATWGAAMLVPIGETSRHKPGYPYSTPNLRADGEREIAMRGVTQNAGLDAGIQW